jgi:RNA polymerase sigma factor (sigma-70 family)
MSGSTAPIPTRRSLLSRIKDPADQRSWREFHDTYHGLIREAAVRAGLSAEAAEDTVQETLTRVSRDIGEFKATGADGAFKTWLFEITRAVIEARQQRPATVPSAPPTAATALAPRPPEPDRPPPTPLDRVWDEEWRRNIEERALEALKQEAAPHDFQIFFLNVLRGHSAFEVARALGTNVLKVYLLKRLLLPRYQRALREAEDHAGAPRVPPMPAT